MKAIYVVLDPLLTKDDDWESHFTSILLGYIESKNLTGYHIEEYTDLAVIKSKFEKKEIQPNSLFIYPNAWSPATTYVKHWSETYQIPIKSIGLWSKGCFVGADPEFRPLNDRNWRKVYERANFRCLDKSFFVTEYFKEQFRIYVSKAVFPSRLEVLPFPLDYLPLEMEMYKDNLYKQDIVIFPWHTYNTLEEQFVYDFIRVFKDIKVIFAQEHNPLTRAQLLTQISKAKVAFLPYTYPNIGKEIYECLLLNTIPLVPDIEGIRDLVPADFRYPPEWTDNILSYCQYAPNLVEKIKQLTFNYSSYKNAILEYQEYLYLEHFNSDRLFTQILKD